MSDGLMMTRRIRRTPYTARVEQAGVRGYSVYNRMILPKSFAMSVEEAYWHLREHVQIWDVSVQRQVEIAGPDAATLVQWMTPRDLSRAEVGRCYYVPIVDQSGGMLNDPVLLKLAEDRFWLSIADGDLLLYVKGLIIGRGLQAHAFEPDVNPLAIQGPKAEALMVDLFGPAIADLRFYRFTHVDFMGTRQIVARSGFSPMDGFEIYLDDSALGPALWDAVVAAGQSHDIAPGGPNLIDRIEGGLLGYGNEMTSANNPLEMGFGRFCRLDGTIDCIGLEALQRIEAAGPTRAIRGVRFGEVPGPACTTPWPVHCGDIEVGQVTSAAWSPRLKTHVGLSLIDCAHWDPGTDVTVTLPDGTRQAGTVETLPFG
jgi:dimethylsulfoniopropionate demethylase